MKQLRSALIPLCMALLPLISHAQEESEDTYQITRKLSCINGILQKQDRQLTKKQRKKLLRKFRFKIEDAESDRRAEALRDKRRDIRDCGALDNDDSQDNSNNDNTGGSGSDSDDGRNCPSGFAKQVKVFGVRICASSKVSDAKVLHAARIMAQYLDNDENGVADDPFLIETLVSKGALLEMFQSQNEMDKSDVNIPNNVISQPLFGNETLPGQMDQGVFDFSLEEIWHLISSAGLHYAYPSVFGENPGSRLTDAMDIARGGRFTTIPNPYPESAWYTYDDKTCEYICMASEYFYWALTSLLGAQDIPGRGEEIQNEWRPNTPEKLQAQDQRVHQLLTEEQNKGILPKVLPDETYAADGFTVSKL